MQDWRFALLNTKKLDTAVDLFHWKCWNDLQQRIYSIQNAEIKYGYEFIPMKKAKIKHNLGFIPLKRLKYGAAGENLVLSGSFHYKRKCLKDYPHNLAEYEINWTSISPVCQLFIVNIVNYSLLLLLFIHWTKHFFVQWSWSQKNLKVQRRLILKKTIHHLFHEVEDIETSS